MRAVLRRRSPRARRPRATRHGGPLGRVTALRARRPGAARTRQARIHDRHDDARSAVQEEATRAREGGPRVRISTGDRPRRVPAPRRRSSGRASPRKRLAGGARGVRRARRWRQRGELGAVVEADRCTEEAAMTAASFIGFGIVFLLVCWTMSAVLALAVSRLA